MSSLRLVANGTFLSEHELQILWIIIISEIISFNSIKLSIGAH